MHTFMLILYVISSVLSMLTVGYVVNKEADEGQKYILAFLISSSVQNLGCLFEFLVEGEEAIYLAWRMQYLGSAFLMLFLCEYVFYICTIKKPKYAFKIIAVLDVICVGIMWFDDRFRLFYSKLVFVSDGVHPHFESVKGPVFYINYLVSYGLPILLTVWALLYCAVLRRSKQFIRRIVQFTIVTLCGIFVIGLFQIIVKDNSYNIAPFVIGMILYSLELFFWGRTTYDLERMSMKVLTRELDEAILIVDDMKRVVECNDVADKLFSCLKGGVVPDGMLDDNGGVSYSQENMYHWNGRIFEKHVKPIQNKTGEVNGNLVMLYDVTKLYDDMEELRLLQEEAETANKAKTKFLANMSHEIRTPINAILGMNTMILQETEDVRLREYATDIKNAGETLLSIINDILDLSKVESGKLEIIMDDYDFGSTLNDVINIIQFQAMKKNIKLRCEIDKEIPAKMYGDVVRIRQILINLLNNAVKYTNEGEIVFSVKEKSREDGFIVLDFSVKDTGIGIKEENIPYLFEPFERIDEKHNRHIEGTGLGIALTIQMLNLMETELQVESEYGVGSRFFFSLKQKIVDVKPVGNLVEKIRGNNNVKEMEFVAPDARVLVVDDNRVNCKVFSGLLKNTQIKIDEVYSGAECLQNVQKIHYDMIFLDHMMPQMDGIETLKRMKELEENMCKGVPVIALTANAVAGAKERYLEAGFDDFLPKPIQLDKLEQMMIKLLPGNYLNVSHKEVSGKKEKSLADLPEVSGFVWKAAWQRQPDMNKFLKMIYVYYKALTPNAKRLEEYYDKMFSEDLSPEESDNVKHDFEKQLRLMANQSVKVGAMQMNSMASTLLEGLAAENMELVRGMTKVFLQEWNKMKDWMPQCFEDTEYENKLD